MSDSESASDPAPDSDSDDLPPEIRKQQATVSRAAIPDLKKLDLSSTGTRSLRTIGRQEKGWVQVATVALEDIPLWFEYQVSSIPL